MANHLNPGAYTSRSCPDLVASLKKKKKKNSINSVPKQLMNNVRVSEEATINSIPLSRVEQVEEIKLRQMELPLLLLETRLEDKPLGQVVKWAETRQTCP